MSVGAQAGWHPCLAVCALVLAACSPPAADPPVDATPVPARRIVLVTLDTTRADHIGAYGDARAATPTLDRLAAEGVLFEAALASAPVTLPSHSSILTGVYPTSHGVRDNGVFSLTPAARLVSEVFRERGWRTAAFVGSFVLAPRYGLDQGFELYSEAPLTEDGLMVSVERGADAVIDDTIEWLESIAPDEPFFVWVHFYDPHAPYDPPEPWASRAPSPYDGEIAFCDAQLDRLLRFLERRDMDDDLLVAVTADHGESLGEHREDSHAIFIYDATIRVPLILSGAPVAASAGLRVRETVPNTALAPTLLTLAGIGSDALPDVTLSPLLAANGSPPRTFDDSLYIESYPPYYTFRWRALRGLHAGDAVLIDGSQPELYDTESDPGELHDLAPEAPERVAALRRQLEAVIAANPPLGWVAEQEPSPQDRRLLASLGYTSSPAGGDPLDASLPDPREKIDELVLLGRAAGLDDRAREVAVRPGATAWQADERDREVRELRESARAVLVEARAKSPDNMMALARLAVIEKQLGNHEAAIPLFEEFLALRPFEVLERYRLATSYFAVGREDDAVREIQQILSEDVHFTPAYEWMFQQHTRLEQPAEALRWVLEELKHADEGSARYLELIARREQLAPRSGAVSEP